MNDSGSTEGQLLLLEEGGVEIKMTRPHCLGTKRIELCQFHLAHDTMNFQVLIA